MSTLLGALLTYSAILFTNALDLRKRKRTADKLIHALLQGLHDEISGLVEMARNHSVPSVDATPEGQPYEGRFSAGQDYFTVYHSNAKLVMQIEDGELRRSVIQTYTHAKGLLDTVNMNRLYLDRYYYLKSTFLKTRDTLFQAESESYHQTLVQITTQLKIADAEFRKDASRVLEMLAKKMAAPHHVASLNVGVTTKDGGVRPAASGRTSALPLAVSAGILTRLPRR